MRESITTGDRRLIALVAAVVSLSILYIWRNHDAAFPQASLDLKFSRSEITARAGSFLRSQNLNTAGFRNITLFDPDDQARLFLERQAGLEQANRLMSSTISVWRWRARWYKPPHKEEMIVHLSPSGELKGFQHIIDESAPGASLAPDAARLLANAFLAAQTTQPHRLIQQRQQQRPNRLDHSFTFERNDFSIHQATYRRDVTVQGSKIGAYSEYLHVPEQWERDFAALRSSNELYAQIAQAFYVLLIIAALISLLLALKAKSVSWTTSLLISGAIGFLAMINQWNALPFFLDRMPTSSTHAESVLLGLLQGLGAGVGIFLYICLAAAPGQGLYQRAFPRNLRLPVAFSRRGLQTREFFRATIAGYGFAAAHIAFVVAFYLIGKRFGVWSPQDVPYSDLLSTALPWLYPLTISLIAAFSEEFWFRLLAVPLLLRWRWAACLIPAFVWGFLHATYPQQPGYIRGIEVGIIGVAATFLMFRFGILATLIWHYTVDAALIGMFLFQSASWYFRLSGALVAGAVLLPFLYAVFSYRRAGGFLLHEENDVPSPAAHVDPSPEPLLPPLPPLGNPRLLYFAAALALGVGLLFSARPFGDWIRLHISREQALAAIGPIHPGWQSVVTFEPNLDSDALEYIRRLNGRQAAIDAVRNYTNTGLWRIRLFQPGQKTEIHHYIGASGKRLSTVHVLEEKAAGANLTPPPAKTVAESQIARLVNLDDYRLIDSSHQKRDHRTDHSFTFEHRNFKIAQATARISLDVLGDQPSGLRRFLKLPEAWVRQFHKPRILSFLPAAFGGALFFALLLALLRRLGSHGYHWRAYLGIAIVSASLLIVGELNEWPLFFAGYETETPWNSFAAESILGSLMRILLLGLLIFLGALSADVFLQAVQGRRRLLPPTPARTLSLAALLWGFSRLSAWVSDTLPGDRLNLPLWNLYGVASYWPAVEILQSALFTAIAGVTVAVTIAAAAVLLLRPARLAGWLLVYAAAIALGGAISPALIAWKFFSALLACALILLAIRCSGAALLDLAMALFLTAAISPAIEFLKQPAPFYQAQAAIALTITVLAAFSWWSYWARASRSTPPPSKLASM